MGLGATHCETEAFLGDKGTDLLSVGAGAATLPGGVGSDILSVGRGHETLNGGARAAAFAIAGGLEVARGNKGADTVCSTRPESTRIKMARSNVVLSPTAYLSVRFLRLPGLTIQMSLSTMTKLDRSTVSGSF